MDFILEAFKRIIKCIAFYGFIVFRIKLHGKLIKVKGLKNMHFFDIVIVVVIVDWTVFDGFWGKRYNWYLELGIGNYCFGIYIHWHISLVNRYLYSLVSFIGWSYK